MLSTSRSVSPGAAGGQTLDRCDDFVPGRPVVLEDEFVSRGGQREAEARALTECALDLGRSIGRIDDVLHDGEPEARAARRARAVGAEERSNRRGTSSGRRRRRRRTPRARRSRPRDGRGRGRLRRARIAQGVVEQVPSTTSSMRGRMGTTRPAGTSLSSASSARSARSCDSLNSSATYGATSVKPSATTSRPCSSSERKRMSSTSCVISTTSAQASSISAATSTPGSLAVSSSESRRASGVRSSWETAAVNPTRRPS